MVIMIAYVICVLVSLLAKTVVCQEISCNGYQIEDVNGDRLCVNCTVCPPGQGVKIDCTNDSDTVCEPCIPGQSYSALYSDVMVCEPCTHCSPHQEVIYPCNITHNAKCGDCQPGYFQNVLTDLCEECSYCYLGLSIHQQDCDVAGVPARFQCMPIRNTPYPPPLRYTTTTAMTTSAMTTGDAVIAKTTATKVEMAPSYDRRIDSTRRPTESTPTSLTTSSVTTTEDVTKSHLRTTTITDALVSITVISVVTVCCVLVLLVSCRKKLQNYKKAFADSSNQLILSAEMPVSTEDTLNETSIQELDDDVECEQVNAQPCIQCAENDEASEILISSDSCCHGSIRHQSCESGYHSDKNDGTENNRETDSELVLPNVENYMSASATDNQPLLQHLVDYSGHAQAVVCQTSESPRQATTEDKASNTN